MQKIGVCEGWSREPSRSVFDFKPILLNLGHTWNDLVNFKNTVLNLRDSAYILCLGSKGQRMKIRLHQKKVKTKAAHHPAERPEVGGSTEVKVLDRHMRQCQGRLVTEAFSYFASHLF